MKVAILILALVGILYNLVLALVQHRSAANPTPQSVSDVYDAETYQKWKAYSRERGVLSIVFTCITGVITLAMLASNVYAAFASLFPSGVFMQLLAVILLEMAVSTVVNVFLGSVWRQIMVGKGYWYYVGLAAIKNVALLPLEVAVLIIFLGRMMPLLKRAKIISPEAEFSMTRRDIVFTVIISVVGIAALAAYVVWKLQG